MEKKGGKGLKGEDDQKGGESGRQGERGRQGEEGRRGVLLGTRCEQDPLSEDTGGPAFSNQLDLFLGREVILEISL